MKLMKLRIRNFKGIEAFELDLNGRDAAICGDNATGKTSIFDALQWLLFGKDSQGRSDFEVKPLGTDGKAKQNGLDVEVWAELEHNGRRIRLSKVMSENWTRPRGSSQAVFTGHSTGYEVDELPVKQKQYQEIIEGLIPEKRFRLLTNPYYFSSMLPWKERREILFEIAGEVTDADVLSSSTQFAPLADALNGHDVEDFRKILSAEIKRINKELTALPVRIDETTRVMTEAVDVAAARAMVEALQMQRRTIENQLISPDTARMEAEAAKLEAEISRQKAEILSLATQARNRWELERQNRIDEARARMDAIEAGADESASLGMQIRRLETEQELCRKEWMRIRESRSHVETVCPTCGRPYDNQETLQAAARAFEQQKEKMLTELEEKGRGIGREIDGHRQRMAETMTRAKAVQAAREAIRGEIAQIRAETYTPPVLDDSVLKQLENQKAGILAQIAAVKAGVQQDNMAVYGQLAAIDSRIKTVMADIARQEQNERAAARIDELMEEQRTLAAKMDEAEHLVYLAEEFTRVKVQMIQRRVDGAFMFARFKLFDEQVNGGLADACEVTVNGVPFKDLNHAMQINVGLDVIRTLGMRYGVTAPVIVDNAESVIALEPMNCQLIRLVVSENDKQLRLEV